MIATEPYRQAESGLFVPNELSRKRQVWTKDEFKALDKAIRLLGEHQIKLLLKCDSPKCEDPTLVRINQPGGGYLLRCGCRDRIFQKAF